MIVVMEETQKRMAIHREVDRDLLMKRTEVKRKKKQCRKEKVMSAERGWQQQWVIADMWCFSSSVLVTLNSLS